MAQAPDRGGKHLINTDTAEAASLPITGGRDRATSRLGRKAAATSDSAFPCERGREDCVSRREGALEQCDRSLELNKSPMKGEGCHMTASSARPARQRSPRGFPRDPDLLLDVEVRGFAAVDDLHPTRRRDVFSTASAVRGGINVR